MQSILIFVLKKCSQFSEKAGWGRCWYPFFWAKLPIWTAGRAHL